ncbi:hypothetical protein QBC39DRAFT_373665 [Podospora conica]|nr:hypothetical protein QBC39DRAFT_373665 [Schizothecium conicum]
MAPEQTTQPGRLDASTGYTPSYASEEDRFEPAPRPVEGIQTAYMSPQSQAGGAWNGSVPATAGSEDYENYALHSSPTAIGYTQGCSNQSSPRSWPSPDQYRPWDSAPEPLQSQYSRHSQQQSFGGFQMREGPGYAHSSQPVLSSTSFPASSVYLPSHNYESATHGFPHHGHADVYHQSPYPLEGLSNVPDAHPLSPCSPSLGYVKHEDEIPSPGPISDGGHDAVNGLYNHGTKSHSRQSSSVPSTPGNSSTAKVEEPYAQLIFRAFKSHPRHAMTLQDLYQWFRENTDKGKNDTKGWQNSIRHNLSMNRAFTKRERKSISGEDDVEEAAAAAADPNNLDSKKATEWFLEPWALQDGVQSTTRYRKDNTGRRSGSHRSAGASSRKKHGSHHHITSNGSGSGRMRSRLQSTSSGLHHSMHYAPHHLASLHHPHPRPALIMPPFGSTSGYMDYQHHHEQPQQLQPPAMFSSEHYRPLYSAQTRSESGADEPVTPEASYHDGLPLPELHGRAASSSRNSTQAVAAAYYGAAGEGLVGGVDMAGYTYPSAAAAPVVNVYDEVVDRYGGWVGGVEETTAATGYNGHHGQGQY